MARNAEPRFADKKHPDRSLVSFRAKKPAAVRLSKIKMPRQALAYIPVRPRRVSPVIRVIRNTTRKMKNRSFAIPAAATATPPNPKIAAIIATIRNTNAQ